MEKSASWLDLPIPVSIAVHEQMLVLSDSSLTASFGIFSASECVGNGGYTTRQCVHPTPSGLVAFNSPEWVLAARLGLQIVIVHKVGCVARFKAGEVSNLLLTNDFARRDLFAEVVSVIGDQAAKALAVKLSLFHPNLLFGAGAEQHVKAG